MRESDEKLKEKHEEENHEVYWAIIPEKKKKKIENFANWKKFLKNDECSPNTETEFSEFLGDTTT